VLNLSLFEVNEKRILRRERDGVSAVEPLKYLTEPARVSLRTLGPQSTARGDEGSNFAFNEGISLLSDPKTMLIEARDAHRTILALLGPRWTNASQAQLEPSTRPPTRATMAPPEQPDPSQ